MSEWVTIVGFGSLLSKRSALTTTPSLRNYQYVRVKGFQRLFTCARPSVHARVDERVPLCAYVPIANPACAARAICTACQIVCAVMAVCSLPAP